MKITYLNLQPVERPQERRYCESTKHVYLAVLQNRAYINKSDSKGILHEHQAKIPSLCAELYPAVTSAVRSPGQLQPFPLVRTGTIQDRQQAGG